MTIYGMLTEAGDGIKRVEVDASEFHATHAPEAEEIWVQGLNTLLRAMDPFDGYRPGDDRAHVADQNPDLQHDTPSRRPAAIAFFVDTASGALDRLLSLRGDRLPVTDSDRGVGLGDSSTDAGNRAR
jgi:hypothetical protein